MPSVGGIPFLQGGAAGIAVKLAGLAGGGHLRAGEPAIVGENGPELWRPNTAGRVIPNPATAAALSGGIARVNLNIDRRKWVDQSDYELTYGGR